MKKKIAKDIGYRGIFSCRGLRLIALLAMTESQLAAIMLGIRQLAAFVSPELGETVMSRGAVILFTVLQSLGAVTFPLLLIASMSVVIRDRKKIFRVMISNLLLAGVTYLFITQMAETIVKSMIMTLPQVVGDIPNLNELLQAVLNGAITRLNASQDALEASGLSTEMIAMMISGVTGVEFSGDLTGMLEVLKEVDLADLLMNGVPMLLSQLGISTDEIVNQLATVLTESALRRHLNVNVFWDLFLCTVFYFFADYTPKRLSGGKLLLFRCGAVLPALYLMVGVVVTGMNRADWVEMSLPLEVVALLPSRRLPGILLFLSMVLYVKYHEAEIIAAGGGQTEMDVFMRSNRGSLHFSLFICGVLLLLSLSEWALGTFDSGVLADWGIGQTSTLYMAVPFVLLFSFNRQPKIKALDAVVPVYYILHYVIMVFAVAAAVYILPEVISGVSIFEAVFG